MRIPQYLPIIFVIGGALLSAVGGILGNLERAESGKKLAAKSEELFNLTTGRSSYAFLTPGYIQEAQDACPLTLRQVGPYPVQVFSVRIVDLTTRYQLMKDFPRYQITNVPETDRAVVRLISVGNRASVRVHSARAREAQSRSYGFD